MKDNTKRTFRVCGYNDKRAICVIVKGVSKKTAKKAIAAAIKAGYTSLEMQLERPKQPPTQQESSNYREPAPENDYMKAEDIPW